MNLENTGLCKYMDNRKWIALCSRTGTEIYSLAKKINRKPDLLIYYSNVKHDLIPEIKLDPEIKIVYLSRRPETETYKKYLGTPGSSLITLHGWMYIIPEGICTLYDIVNLHPGDIVTFPELKGKDPQQKAYELNLPTSGAVIHKVIPEVDEGTIYSVSDKVNIQGLSLEEVYKKLRKVSIDLWVDYFKLNKLCN